MSTHLTLYIFRSSDPDASRAKKDFNGSFHIERTIPDRTAEQLKEHGHVRREHSTRLRSDSLPHSLQSRCNVERCHGIFILQRVLNVQGMSKFLPKISALVPILLTTVDLTVGSTLHFSLKSDDFFSPSAIIVQTFKIAVFAF
jgi:hypothetical protein